MEYTDPESGDNYCMVSGSLVKDVTYFRAKTGLKPMCKFTIIFGITKEIGEDGKEEAKRRFMTIVTWGTLAKYARHLEKWDIVLATGRKVLREWTDNEGNKQQMWQLHADTIFPQQIRFGSAKHLREMDENDEDDDGSIAEWEKELPF